MKPKDHIAAYFYFVIVGAKRRTIDQRKCLGLHELHAYGDRL